MKGGSNEYYISLSMNCLNTRTATRGYKQSVIVVYRPRVELSAFAAGGVTAVVCAGAAGQERRVGNQVRAARDMTIDVGELKGRRRVVNLVINRYFKLLPAISNVVVNTKNWSSAFTLRGGSSSCLLGPTALHNEVIQGLCDKIEI